MEQKMTGTILDKEIVQDFKTEETDIRIRDFDELSDNEKIDCVAERILKKYRRAFEALAK